MPSTSTRSPTDARSGVSAVAMLRELLDEERLQQEVDHPLDEATQSLQLRGAEPGTQRAFLDCIAAAVQHLYEHGLRCPRRLPRRAAVAEAVDLIRRGYPGRPEDRFDTALLEATASRGGDVQSVIGVLVETIRSRERRRYIDWVFATVLDPLDWNGHVEAATELREALESEIHADLKEHDPARLSREVRELFFLDRNPEAQLRQILG